MAPARADSVRVFLLLLLTTAGFFQAATWGSASRLDLARALVERGTISIDAYHENTGDKAVAGDHVYTDKAPLPSFLATPGVALAHGLRRATGWPASESLFLAVMGGFAAIFASGIVTAAGAVAFHAAVRERVDDPLIAWRATFLAFLGTTIFPYATLLQGHAPAAAWLVMTFYAWFPADGRGPGTRRAAMGGVAASCALATEYLTGPPLVVMAIATLLRGGSGTNSRTRADRAGPLHRAVAMAAGAFPGLALLGVYHAAAFGSPFSLGYQTVALPFFREKMSTGLLGVHAPDLGVALRLLFDPYRGLFPASPVLMLAFPGLALLLREPRRRLESAVALLIFVYYWLLQSGHATWHGGWAIGPRHVVAAIPLLGFGLPEALRRWPRATHLSGALSVGLLLAATAVGPEVPETVENPFSEHVLPHFFRGEFSVGEQGFGELYPARLDPAQPDRWDAFLVGEALRLPKHLALLPTLAVWALLWPRRRRS